MADVVPTEIRNGNMQKPAASPYVLSDLDVTMPDTLVTPFLVYKLPSVVNIEAILSAFHDGLSKASQQLPSLAANIQFDSAKKPLRTMAPVPLKLSVRVFEIGQYKSYDELAASSFSPYEFNRELLLPGNAFDYTLARPVCVPQLNIIPGGIILALGFNHILLDMASIDMAISLICRCVKSCLNRTDIEPAALDFDRAPFNAPSHAVLLSRSKLLERVADFQVIDATAPASSSAAKTLESLDTMNKGLVYRITGAAAKSLKQSCELRNGVSYVSSYDCIVGLIWSRVLCVRMQRDPDLEQSSSRFLHPVDLRNRPQSGVPANYYGNAVSVASAVSTSVSELVGADGFSAAACAIRSSIESTTQDSIAHLTAVGALMGENEKLQYRPPGLLRENFLTTSWYSVNTAAWDFGLGRPSIVRNWVLPMPGCAIIFPDCGQESSGPVYDVFVILPNEDQEILRQDSAMKKWFKIL